VKFSFSPGKDQPESVRAPAARPRFSDTTPSALASLIMANLYPCYAAIAHGWSVGDVVILYWVESLVAVVYTYLKMRRIPRDWLHYAEGEEPALVNGEPRPPYYIPRLFLVFYGFAGSVHGFFVIMFFLHAVTFGWAAFAVATFALVCSHGISFVTNYLGRREYEQATLKALMNAPLKRLLFLHLFILVAGIPFSALALLQNAVAVILFVALKTAADLYAHLREHAAAKVGEKGTELPPEG